MANERRAARKTGRRNTALPGHRASPKNQEASDRGSLEDQIVALAVGGKLAGAGRRAIEAQRKGGLPVTFMRGDEIIKAHPDGREEVLGKVERVPYTLPKGVAILGKQ
jgi:hypothetical protein